MFKEEYRTAAVLITVFFVAATMVAATGTAAGQTAEAPDCSTVNYSGEGTATNPYEVSDIEQLQCIKDQGLDANYRLVSDIDASETSEWNDGAGFEPLGRVRDAFTGTFSGADNTVANLTVNTPNEDRVGLFGAVGSNGTVDDVNLDGLDVKGEEEVGGLIGSNSGTVSESSTSGKVNGSESVGGLVGHNGGGSITDSSASAELAGFEGVGGLVGDINEGSGVERSYATGTVEGSFSAGGLVGDNSGNVTASYANGDVNGPSIDAARFTGSERLGGLVGYNSGTVTESYAMGSVKGEREVGGLVGQNGGGSIKRSYATGVVRGSDGVGGLIGFNSFGLGTVTHSYWDTETTGQPNSGEDNALRTEEIPDSGGTGATGLTTSEMTGDEAPDNMTGFDFEETWQTTDEYPRLAWQVEEDEDSKEDGDASTGSERLPGFTVVTALITLLTVAVVLLRRS